jgi:hypothetical protein
VRDADSRVRIIELAHPNLAAALNAGCGAAASGLIARMDSDDECAPHRLEAQMAFLVEHPDLAGVNCDWEVRDAAGNLLAVRRPPRTSAESAWGLLIENPFAHGAMMLRTSRLLEAGGYDPRWERAQDLDLWLRLRPQGGIGAVPQVLYTHYVRQRESFSSSPLQAQSAATILAHAWSRLESGETGEISRILQGAMAGGEGASPTEAIKGHLNVHGPSREGLIAYLWLERQFPGMNRRAADVARRSHVGMRLQSILTEAGGIWLYGAGAHTRWLLDTFHMLRGRVRGIVDDHMQWQTCGENVVSGPLSVLAGEHVVISSDSTEDVLWERSLAMRQRGVVVHRLYAAEP